MLIAKNATTYVVAYLALMAPTYILPYFGSNSTLANAFSTALGMGPMPQWWAHAWCLIMLVLLCWLRGNAIGKGFLPAFPVLAGAFDMIPGLSMIPLVPTLLHTVGIVLGVKDAPQIEIASISERELAITRKAKLVAGGATLFAVAGSLLFISTGGRNLKSLQNKSEPRVVKAPAATKQVEKLRPTGPIAKPTESASTIATAPESPSAFALPIEKSKPTPKTTKVQPVQSRPEQKPVSPEKPTVRYIRLND